MSTKLPDLTSLSSLSDTDLVYVVDVSDMSDALDGSSKRVTLSDLSAYTTTKLWPRTSAEISAGVTPTNYQYEPGNVLRYGATGDGVTNDTSAIQAALSIDIPVHFPNGTYILTVSSAVNISGVPRITGDNAIIDCSSSTSTVIFDANGSKTSVKTAQSFGVGDSTIDVTGLGLTFEKGQPILITSIETHPNTVRATYFKGTRSYVDAVVSNELRLYPQIDFDYTSSAYVWRITENDITVRGLKMIGNPAVNQAGMVLTLCNADIECDFNYFPSACIRFESSRGKYTGRCRYPYIVNGSTNYGVAVTDLSEVSINGAHITGTRHAVTVGGGTWAQTDSGGVSGQAAYPASCTISGGHYGSSRSGTAYATDPSLEIGAIDSHGIAKSLICTGAVIYGGCKVAPAESVIIQGNTIYHRNYSCFEVVDSDNYDWGYLKISDNDCFFIGDSDTGGTPSAIPQFVNVGSTVFGNRLDVNNNRYTVPENVETGTTSLGLVRGFNDIRFNDNSIYVSLAAATDEARLELWGRRTLDVCNNVINNASVYLRPVRTSTSSLCVATIAFNRSNGSGSSGLLVSTNSLDASATFMEMTFDGNRTRNAQNSGIRLRADMMLRCHLLGNHAVNNNVAGSASDYLNSGIGIQGVASTDILELLVLSGNVSSSDSDATNAHDNGIYIATGSAVNTDVYCVNNISHGFTTAAITGLGSTGQTIKQEHGNTETIQTYTPTNVSTDRAWDANAAVTGTGIDVDAVTGTNVALLSDHDALVAVVQELSDVVGTLVTDLQTQGLIK